MADSARENLDDIIAVVLQDTCALRHLADAMANNKKKHDHEVDDMIGSLVRCANRMEQYRKDLEEVRAVYDSKVHGEPVA